MTVGTDTAEFYAYPIEGTYADRTSTITIDGVVKHAESLITPYDAEQFEKAFANNITEITLAADISLVNTIVIPEGKAFTVNLNGFTLDASANQSRPFEMGNGSSLTVNGENSTVKTGKWGFINIPAGNSATVVLNNGSYEAQTDNGSFIKPRGAGNMNITMNNVTYEDKGTGYILDASSVTELGKCSITVNGGTYTAPRKLLSYGELTLKNATINTDSYAVDIYGTGLVEKCIINVSNTASSTQGVNACGIATNGTVTVNNCQINCPGGYGVLTHQSGGTMIVNNLTVGTGTNPYYAYEIVSDYMEATSSITIDGVVVATREYVEQ